MERAHMPEGGTRRQFAEFDLGPIRVRPSLRLLESSSGSVSVEPLVMQILIAVGSQAGRLVTRRELFELCWGSSAIGDDSLNRAVAVLRRALRQVAGDSVRIETVPASGYVLRLSATCVECSANGGNYAAPAAIEAGRQSLLNGVPAPDYLRIEQLRAVVGAEPGDAAAWGMLALLLRYAAEYAEPHEGEHTVAECERAAGRALALDRTQTEALVAIATVAPLFGRWSDARSQLQRIIELHGDHPAAMHELAIVEMATGRVRHAKMLIDALLRAEPLAPAYCYKSIWQHWSVNDLTGMDHVADRAIQLWPTHPAVWTARFWTLAFTGRAHAALHMVEDSTAPAGLPVPTLRFFGAVTSAAASRDDAAMRQAIDLSTAAAQHGPAHAVAALLALGLLGAVDEAFEVADAYYTRAGATPVPVRRSPSEPSINDQHRRVTQLLFTPAGAGMRSDSRFPDLCERLGLTQYWEEVGLGADYLSPSVD